MRVIEGLTKNTDQQLLALVQAGEEKAFDTLYWRYYLPLCQKAFQRVPSVPRVEEMVQDVFVNFWLKAATLDTDGNVRAYLYATLNNKILHELRTESNRLHYLATFEKLRSKSKANASLEQLYAQETEHRIAQVLKALPVQCREAFCLSRFEHLSYKEIAERMELSVRTVEKHIGKALRILREKLVQYEDAFPILLLLVFFSF